MLKRKNRMLLLSALILTVIFIIITTTTSLGGAPDVANTTAKLDNDNSKNNNEVALKETTKEQLKQMEEVALKLEDTNNNLNDVVKNPKSGEIDESKVKQAEEIISSKKGSGSSGSRPKELLSDGNVSPQQNTIFDAAKEFKEILSVSPVVIFSKTYCPYSQSLKSLLSTQYNITPEPAIVELDKHKNGAELQLYIGEISGRKTVPNLYIKGVSRGGSDDIHALHNQNTLLDNLVEWGDKSISVDKVNVPSNS